MPKRLPRTLTERISALLRTPLFALPAWQRRLALIYRVLRHCIPRVTSRESQQMAAALTYHTVFAVLPTLVLVMVTLQAFVSDARREELKEDLVDWIVEPLRAEQAAAEPDEDVAPNFVGPPAPTDAEARQEEFEEVQQVLDEKVASVLDSFESINFGSIGVLGFLLFLLGTTGLLTTIQSTFDVVFGADNSRPARRRIPIYYALLTIGPVLLAGGQWAQAQLLKMLAGGMLTSWLAAVLAVLSPILTVWLLLFAMFTLMPTTRVNRGAAALGSFISAVAWVIGIEAFGFYVSRAAITSLYGALAFFPLGLLWIFITWQLLLVGAEFTSAVQSLREAGRLPPPPHKTLSTALISPGWTLEVATLAAEAFVAGKSVTTSDLQRRLGLPPRATHVILAALQKAGILRPLAEEGDFGLARPADQIQVNELVALHKTDVDRSALVKTDTIAIRQRFHDWGTAGFGDRTLQDLVKDARPEEPTGGL